jgi:intracellular sulfur oxidation DsrE/DsrF family protein
MRWVLLTLLLVCSTAFAEDVRVVFHLDNAEAQTSKAIRQINNQLNVESTTKITIVASGNGLEIFTKGYANTKGEEYAPQLAELKKRNVRFEACTYSMGVRGFTKEQMLDSIDYVPSGSGRISELQFREHYVYFKP